MAEGESEKKDALDYGGELFREGGLLFLVFGLLEQLLGRISAAWVGNQSWRWTVVVLIIGFGAMGWGVRIGVRKKPKRTEQPKGT